MVKEDLLKVYACAGALWSSFKIPATEFEAKLFDDVWFDVLKGYDVKIVLIALKEYAKTNDFCNIAKVGELCEKFIRIANGTWVDEEFVLQEIRKAISAHNKKEQFEKLSPFAQRVVEGAWQLTKWGQSENVETVVMSNLRKKVHNMLENDKFEKIVGDLKLLNCESQGLLDG